MPETMDGREYETGMLALTLGRVIECKNTRCKSAQRTTMGGMLDTRHTIEYYAGPDVTNNQEYHFVIKSDLM